jgi:hypothetical protein
VGLTTPHRKKPVTNNLHKPRTWTDSLDKRPKLWNTDMRFGTRKVMDPGEVGWGDVDWSGLAQDRNRWRALVNSVLNLRVS